MKGFYMRATLALNGLIENIQFKTISDKFLNKLNENINKISSSDKIFVSANKNYYEIIRNNYSRTSRILTIYR